VGIQTEVKRDKSAPGAEKVANPAAIV